MSFNEYFTNFDNALDNYLNEFYEKPDTIEEYKINFLKNHYYYFIEEYIDVTRDNLLIKKKKNKNYIYFQCKLNTNLHLVFDRTYYKYYLKFNNPNLIEELYIHEVNYKHRNRPLKHKINYRNNQCFNCIIN